MKYPLLTISIGFMLVFIDIFILTLWISFAGDVLLLFGFFWMVRDTKREYNHILKTSKL